MSEFDVCARMEQIKALGIGNIFTLDYSSDLEMVANYLSAHIGVTLAMLADIHYLISTRELPLLPSLLKRESYFNDLNANKMIYKTLYDNYRVALCQIRDEECFLADESRKSDIYKKRDIDISNIQKSLGIEGIPNKLWDERIRDFVKEKFNFEDKNFETVWSKFLYNCTDRGFMESIFQQITDEEKKDSLENKIEGL